jgi:nitrate reductase cytochrome c-type subunit
LSPLVPAFAAALHLLLAAAATAPASKAPAPKGSSAARSKTTARGAQATPSTKAKAKAKAPVAPAPVPVPAAAPDRETQYQLVREKCVRCHGFDRAVNTRLTPADWKRHLKKMSLRPNTAVSDEQASAILEFLQSYTPER